MSHTTLRLALHLYSPFGEGWLLRKIAESGHPDNIPAPATHSRGTASEHPALVQTAWAKTARVLQATTLLSQQYLEMYNS